MAVTVRDIAQKANVSAATVSLVLNGKPGISEDTRTRVMQAAIDLNYSLISAKGPKSGKNGTIRFLKIAKHGHTVNRDHNVFISDYIDGMSNEAGQRGYKLEIVTFHGAPIEEVAQSLPGGGLDGAIILGTELSETDIQLFQGPNFPPLVVIDTSYDFLDFNFVNMNNKDAVFKIVSHFHDRGFRKIGLISSNVKTRNFQLRKDAFIQTVREFGLDFNEKDIILVDSTYHGAYEDMLCILKDGIELPECFFCTNDIITYGCIKALRESGVQIPRDLSIIGFDNLPMSSTMDPPLTTIDVSKQKIGHFAITLLDELIGAPEKQPAVKVLVGANLIVRKSVSSRSDQG